MIISNNSLQGQIETAEYKHHKSLMTKILGKFLKVDTESWAKFWGEKKQISFMQYLQTLGIKDNQGFLSETDIEKLLEKLNDLQNNDTISNILDSVFFSKNKTCRLILAMITTKLAYSDSLDYIDLILIPALRELYDKDLRIFCQFFHMSGIEKNPNIVYIENDIIEEQLALNKLLNLNIFGRDNVSRLGDNPNILRYIKNVVSERLFDYISIFMPME